MHKKWSFPLRISSGICGFGQFTLKNLNGKLRYFSAVLSVDTVSYWLEKFLRLFKIGNTNFSGDSKLASKFCEASLNMSEI